MIGGIVAAVAGGIGAAAGMKMLSVADPLFDPSKKLMNDGAWFSMPFMSPDIQLLLKTAFRDDEKGRRAKLGLQLAGIPLFTKDNGVFVDAYKKLWESVIDAISPHCSVEELFYLSNTEQIGKAEANKLYQQSMLSSENKKLLEKVYKARYDLPFIMDMYRRGWFSFAKFEEEIRRTTGLGKSDVTYFERALKVLPTPSDLISMAVKDVFNPELVDKFKLDAEYEDNKGMIELMNASGLGIVKIKSGFDEKEYDIPRMLWQAHWNNPSPTQGYMMSHILRNDERVARFKAELPGLTKFDFEDLRLLLKANDYSPRFRDGLAAISYNLPTLQDLRNAWEYSKIDDKEFLEQIKDRGYTEANAQIIFDANKAWLEPRKEMAEWNIFLKKYDKSFKAALRGYKFGTVSRSDIIDTFTALEAPQFRLIDALNQIDIDINNNIAKKYITMVHREYLMGLYKPEQAVSSLTQGGITEQRAGQLIAVWEREKTYARKVANAGKLVQWYREGWITSEEVKERLENLGWGKADIVLWLAEAYEARSDLEEKVRLANARTEKQKADEEERQRKKNEKKSKEGPQSAQQRVSVATLQKWLKKGIIKEDYFVSQLRYYGYTEDEILNYMVDAIGNG